MKSFACLLVLVAAVVGEPPRYNTARFEPGQQSAAPYPAPYPAAGYKPAAEFPLPARQQLQPPAASYGVPTDSYAAPLDSYAAPQSQYGAPRAEDGAGESTQEPGRKGEADVENLEDSKATTKGKLEDGSSDADVESVQGAYYVLLPGSRLQRVQFRTENDPRNMAYTARLRYSAADRAPLYVYTALPVPAAAAVAAGQPTPAAAAAAYVQLFQ